MLREGKAEAVVEPPEAPIALRLLPRGTLPRTPAAGNQGTARPSERLGRAQWGELGETLGLSRRQIEIVRCVFDGLSEPGIGELLGVSPSRVHTHLDRLYKKLHVHGRCELVVAIFIEYMSRSSGGAVAARRVLQPT